MPSTAESIDRMAPTHRPDDSPIGFQNWSHLLFVHWRVPAYEIQPLLPPELTVDTFDGGAWVGLVPFHMSGVRPWWSPSIPGVSAFHETNVRTYVHLEGREPGVWFFSLDASSTLAVRIARWRWKLPYHRAEMKLKAKPHGVFYSSERLWPGRIGIGCRISAEIGDVTSTLDRNVPPGQAVPGTLEHFLAERYILYAKAEGGPLLRGRVHHAPYPLREARIVEMRQTLVSEAGLELPHPEPDHVLYSPGVNVEIFPLVRV